jgi:hypothetical protein
MRRFESSWVGVALVILLGGTVPGLARPAEAPGSAPLADDATMIALAVALSCADAPETIPAPPSPSEVTPAGPELELVATVKAKSIKFDEVPKVNVVFHGNGKRKTVWKTERVNLPAHPEPGVTYKDVQVKLTITSDIDELASLLSQAKKASRGVRIEGPDAAAPAGASAAPPAAKAAPAGPKAAPPAASSAPATAKN